jgi:acyl-CoA hydrolase
MSAFITASRFARQTVVTASSEKVDFHVPIKHGQLVELIGRVVRSGRTSITVEVEMYGEDLLTGLRELSAKGKFVLVAVDENGKPIAVPSFRAGH